MSLSCAALQGANASEAHGSSGNVFAVWGSAPDDVYVIGDLIEQGWAAETRRTLASVLGWP